MIAERYRRAVAVTKLGPDLDNLARNMWMSYGAGHLTDDEAHEISNAIHARRKPPVRREPGIPIPVKQGQLIPPSRRAPAERQRSQRTPFTISTTAGPYRLPTAVLDRLTGLLQPYRNRDAALALAVFLARFWSTPQRLARAFPIDRRALAGHSALGLTEARVRGAMATLEAVGFLDRAEMPAGSTYQATADGLHRKPLFWQFGKEFLPHFQKANHSATQPRGARFDGRRPLSPSAASRPSTARPVAPLTNSPKNIPSPSKKSMLMGDFANGSPDAPRYKRRAGE